MKLGFAEANLPKKQTDFLSTHPQMTSSQDIGKFGLYTIMWFFVSDVQ